MKKELLLFALIAAAMVVVSAKAVRASDLDDVLDRVRYDVLAERVFEGAADGKPHVLEGFMYFPLKTSGRMVDVQIGPKKFVERSGFRLDAGQMVTVVGMPVVINDREIVLAREVRTTTAIFIVRDRTGRAMWKMDLPIQMDPELRNNHFPVCDVISSAVRRLC